MKKKVFVSMLVLTTMLAGFAGCGAPADEQKSDTPAPSVTEETAEAVIGVNDGSENLCRVELTNKTGLNITGFSIKESSEAEYSDNMIPYGEVYSAEEMRVLYFAPETGTDDATVKSDKATEPQYDAMITVEDGTVFEWKAIPFGDMEAAELCLEENIIYVKYVSANSGEAVNTLEAAKQSAELAEAQGTKTDSKKTEDTKNEKAKTNNTNSGSGSSSSSGDNGCIGNDGLVYDDDNSGGSSSGGSSGGGSSDNSSSGGDDGCIGDDGLTY